MFYFNNVLLYNEINNQLPLVEVWIYFCQWFFFLFCLLFWFVNVIIWWTLFLWCEECNKLCLKIHHSLNVNIMNVKHLIMYFLVYLTFKEYTENVKDLIFLFELRIRFDITSAFSFYFFYMFFLFLISFPYSFSV